MTAEAAGETAQWPEGVALSGEPVRGESTADIVARRISQAIMNGSLPPAHACAKPPSLRPRA